ncbi:hypothetical protein HK405_007640, partial [Cladochytrium tenue]
MPTVNHQLYRRAGRHVRVCALPLRYDQRPKFLDLQLPSDAEGLLFNIEFACRAAALNAVLAVFWTLRDLRAPLRLDTLTIALLAAAVLLAIVLAGAPSTALGDELQAARASAVKSRGEGKSAAAVFVEELKGRKN